MGLVEAAGFNPHDYVECARKSRTAVVAYDEVTCAGYNLRSYDRLHDVSLIRQMEQNSGVSWDQAQAALARMYIGDVGEKYEVRLAPGAGVCTM
jgi:phospholipase D1/2